MTVIGTALAYDLINHVIFVPSGGSGRLRQALVDTLEIEPGDRVLELGCGTGQVTERLVRADAEVTAVDALPEMLAATARRAPRAKLIQGDIFDVDIGEPSYTAVILSFVLHNFDAAGRRRLLSCAASVLAPGGRVGVLDWSCPTGARRARAWRRFLEVLEPSPSVLEVADGRLIEDLDVAGLEITQDLSLALGRCRILIGEVER
ncbi:MAG: class I SAM-dependent methyltransferase [Actinomycetes bacterium]